jgi:hypothetical protein
MRKSRFCASILGLLVAAAPFSGGLAPLATDDTEPGSDTSSLTQVVPVAPTWDDRMKEIIRRMREKMGDPTANIPVPLRVSATALRAWFDLNGLPPELTANDLQEMSADATDLANCADFDPKPPFGTSYSLIVFLHDVGKDLGKAIDGY